MYCQTDNNKFVGRLTGATATFRQGDPDDRLRAINKVEQAETIRQRELEKFAGRKLTPADILRGTVEHPETRSTRELQRLKIGPTSTAEPVDGEKLALEYNRRKMAEESMSHRERMDAIMTERIANRKPPAEPPSKEALALMDEARLFAQQVKFTPQATVEMVERADALMDIARGGDADGYRAAVEGLALDIRCVLSSGIADAEANITAIRDRAGLFDVEKPKPVPVAEPDSLALDVAKVLGGAS